MHEYVNEASAILKTSKILKNTGMGRIVMEKICEIIINNNRKKNHYLQDARNKTIVRKGSLSKEGEGVHITQKKKKV